MKASGKTTCHRHEPSPQPPHYASFHTIVATNKNRAPQFPFFSFISGGKATMKKKKVEAMVLT